VLGNLSIRRIEDTSRETVNLGDSFAARSKILLELRVALTKLDNEARDRMGAEARREIRPPFDVRLDTARNGVANLLPQLDHLPLSELPKWRKFRDDLAAYLEITKDKNRYVLEGFKTFHEVDAGLNDLGTEVAKEQVQIFQRAEALQLSATRTIRLWNLFALLAGLAVAVATTWQVQRRFSQTRQSTEDAAGTRIQQPNARRHGQCNCGRRSPGSNSQREHCFHAHLPRARRLAHRFTTRLLHLRL
jgi:hypothetical protein